MTSKGIGRIRRKCDDGVAAVEFALVLPVLLLILFGIIDFALAYNAQQAVTAAAREAVRTQALGGTPGEVQARADTAGAPLEGLLVDSTTCTPGDPTNVTVTYTYSFKLLNVLPGFGDDMTLTGKGEMRCGG